jgi:AraC-like DNA-binding protein
MDALSEALSTVRMTAAIFYDAEFTAPWGFEAPPAQQVAPVLAPGVEHIVIYHLLTEGKAVAHLDGVEDLPLAAGDIVIIPHGDSYTVSDGSPTTLRDGATSLEKFLSGDLSTTHYGGGGARTRFVCGYFGCERHACRLFLAGLPPLVKVNIRGDVGGEWLEKSIQYLVSEAASRRPGGMVLLSKMAEALFIETLRRYMKQQPPEQTGWLAGARDPVVGRVLALIHRQPCHSWSLDTLATEAGTSRSVVGERFVHFVGESPMSYLARWRLQLAARLLQTTQQTVIRVAAGVGYESEAAFNRAFKREFGLPPAQYRKKLANETGASPSRSTRQAASTAVRGADLAGLQGKRVL